jgi:hypothetical protein
VETPTPAGPEIKDVDFTLPDGTSIFAISVYSSTVWTAMQTGDAPLPVFLGQSGSNVFAESENQDPISNEPISQQVLSQTLPQIVATFKAF